jgi:hypothetical protein
VTDLFVLEASRYCHSNTGSSKTIKITKTFPCDHSQGENDTYVKRIAENVLDAIRFDPVLAYTRWSESKRSKLDLRQSTILDDTSTAPPTLSDSLGPTGRPLDSPAAAGFESSSSSSTGELAPAGDADQNSDLEHDLAYLTGTKHVNEFAYGSTKVPGVSYHESKRSWVARFGSITRYFCVDRHGGDEEARQIAIECRKALQADPNACDRKSSLRPEPKSVIPTYIWNSY